MFQLFALYKHGVATMDRNSFGKIGTEGRHYLRLSTAASMDVLKEGLKRMAAAGKDKQGFAEYFKKGEHLGW
jgi:aspartate/methionine/tyrosine aminotransferase